MNDKDKEAFEEWVKLEDKHDGVFGNNNNFTRDSWIAERAWQAACEYKQKEVDEYKEAARSEAQLVDELLAENKRLKEVISYLPKVPTQPYEKELAQRIQKLQAEKSLMKEAMEFVLGYDGDFLSTSAEIRLNAAKCIVEKVLQEIDKK